MMPESEALELWRKAVASGATRLGFSLWIDALFAAKEPKDGE